MGAAYATLLSYVLMAVLAFILSHNAFIRFNMSLKKILKNRFDFSDNFSNLSMCKFSQCNDAENNPDFHFWIVHLLVQNFRCKRDTDIKIPGEKISWQN